MRQSVRHFLYRWKDELLREPGTPGRYWLFAPSRLYFVLVLLFSVFVLYYTLFYAPSRNPLPLVVMAISVLLGTMAELLPTNRTTLAGALRLVSVVGFISVLVVIMVSALIGV